MSVDSPVRTNSHASDEEPALRFNLKNLYASCGAFEHVLATNGFIQERDADVGFEELVRKHLTEKEQIVSEHTAKLSKTGPSWSPTTTLTEEPETYEEVPDETFVDTSSTAGSDFERVDASSTANSDSEPVLHRKGTLETDKWMLEPSQVLSLLIDELGALTEDDDDEERLILETDGGLVNASVSVLGVIHLTTHRLAFHASLISTNPDLTPAQRIIKSGSAIIHRKGWRSKKRLWLELSSDMLSSYISSKESDRIRPVRTIILSGVNRIEPADPEHPTYVRVIFEDQGDTDRINSGWAEFGTVEAAIDWRKELTAAVFLYRHHRREVLAEDTAGIRISCPLSRIQSAEFLDKCLPGLATLSLIGTDRQPHTIRLGTVYPVAEYLRLPEIIADYKQRHPSNSDDLPIFIDCASISFANTDQSEGDADRKAKTVRRALGLATDEVIWMTKASVHRTINSAGVFVVSTNYICFWCKFITQVDLKYRLHASTVRQAKPFTTFRTCRYGLLLEIEGHPDLKFQFRTEEQRRDAITRINIAIRTAREPRTPSSSGFDTPTSATSSVSTPSRSATGIFSPLERSLQAAIAQGISAKQQQCLPRAINLPSDVLVKSEPKHFVALTIGSRGDVQPYIALGLGLMKEGHTYTIVTHEEYKEWVESFGIRHRQAGGDPGALMKLSVENKMFSPEFFKESLSNFRPWLDSLLVDSWESCQGADILLESPSAMSGVHIAEALNIPYFRCFTMPWTKTAEFPHAFLSPPVESAPINSASYVLFSSVMWAATSGQINRWRRNTLKIGNTDIHQLNESNIPFIYNFSSAVVPKPLDWSDATSISGYWFLDNPEGNNWTPPAGLVEWMAKARAENKPIVYIGFGSITVPHPNRVTARIVKAVLRADVRAIISKGWSARMSKDTDKDPEVEIPPECYQLDKVPHDWLFPQIDAAVHHGGAGTTGASLRAGIPTLIKPWFGDQFFWASRVQKLGAGLRVPSLHAHDFSEALIKATTSRIMKEKAAAVGERIRAEDGVHTAIHSIYRYLDHASLHIEKIRSH